MLRFWILLPNLEVISRKVSISVPLKIEIQLINGRKKESLPAWRETMESYENIMNVGSRLISLIALSLNLDEIFFTKIGALDSPMAFLRLLHYLGEISESDKGNYGASAHSDYGMITLLITDGVPGLQICREKDRYPQLWEDVHHVEGALVVNIGDMMERWTNCTFRSTLHRVVAVGEERYSVLVAERSSTHKRHGRRWLGGVISV